jgi:hypothetical protein
MFVAAVVVVCYGVLCCVVLLCVWCVWCCCFLDDVVVFCLILVSV